MAKIAAVFSDFDGTLCPIDVPRDRAFMSPSLQRLLVEVSRSVPLAIISTKDLAFIKERVPFARALSAISGLETQIGSRVSLAEGALANLRAVNRVYSEVVVAVAALEENVFVERKETHTGELVAFCIDWRLSPNWADARKKVASILRRCREFGLYVVESESHPFADVFPMRVDKGDALVRLKEELKVSGAIMYLGDSEADNSAFDLADVSIAIRHPRVSADLRSRYSLEFSELEEFISGLLAADMNFATHMLKR